MFICVLKTGGIYTKEHVIRLQKQLDRPLTCLTDLSFYDPNIRNIPLLNGWEGWWSKIELFRLMGPMVYLDLDVSIVGNPDVLQTEEFTMWQDPLFPSGFNSSVMSWDVTPTNIYHKFLKDPDTPMKAKRKWPLAGDQGFIQENSLPNRFDDGLILSYRADVKPNGISEGAVVVAYHGKPKPWDL